MPYIYTCNNVLVAHLNIRQAELAALRHHLPVHRHTGAAVIVQAPAVTPLGVGGMFAWISSSRDDLLR